MTKVGVMVCGHGSRDEDAVREFEAVAAGIRARLPQYQVESGFLEFARPIIREGLDAELESAVISAVQEHMKGRMRLREEAPDLIELEGMRVVIERGADLALTAVLSGKEPGSLRKLLRRTLNEVQTRNGDTLRDWDGDIGSLRGVDNAMVGLVESLISESNGSVDLAVDGEELGRERPRREPREVEGVPPLEDEGEPLKLVKDIIGEKKAKELQEGRPEPPEEESSEDD